MLPGPHTTVRMPARLNSPASVPREGHQRGVVGTGQPLGQPGHVILLGAQEGSESRSDGLEAEAHVGRHLPAVDSSERA